MQRLLLKWSTYFCKNFRFFTLQFLCECVPSIRALHLRHTFCIFLFEICFRPMCVCVYLKFQEWWIDFQPNQRICLSFTESTLAVDLTEFRIYCIPRSLSIPWIKAIGSAADRSPLSSVEGKKERTNTFFHLRTFVSCTGKYLSYLYLS
jgi:hypothetical protein